MKIYSKIYLSAIAVIILLFVPLLVSATNEYDLVIPERSLNVQVEDLGESFTTVEPDATGVETSNTLPLLASANAEDKEKNADDEEKIDDLTVKLQIPLPFVDTKCTTKDTDGSTVESVCDLTAYLKGIYRLLIGLGALFAVVMIIIGGYQWMLGGSAGKQDQIGAAKKRILGAVVGLVLALLSFIILNAITPRLVSLRLPKVDPVPPFFSTQTNTCYSVDLLREVLRISKETEISDEKLRNKGNKELSFFVSGDRERNLFSLNDAECKNDYTIVRSGDKEGEPIGQCAGFRCDTGTSCSNKKCEPFFLKGNISWELFTNRYIDLIQLYAVCNNGRTVPSLVKNVSRSRLYTYTNSASAQGDVKGDSYSRLAVAASGPRFRTPTEEKRIKSLQRLESYEIAAQLCSSDGLKGFVLKVEINDDSFGATIDDEYAVGKSGCSKRASGSSAIQHKSDGDLEDRYAYKNINFKEDVDKKDLFSLEDFKQGYQCDLKITNLQFPPLD